MPSSNGASRSFILPDTPLSNEGGYGPLGSGATVGCLLIDSFVQGGVKALVLRTSGIETDAFERPGVLSFFDSVKSETFAESWFEKAEERGIVVV